MIREPIILLLYQLKDYLLFNHKDNVPITFSNLTAVLQESCHPKFNGPAQYKEANRKSVSLTSGDSAIAKTNSEETFHQCIQHRETGQQSSSVCGIFLKVIDLTYELHRDRQACSNLFFFGGKCQTLTNLTAFILIVYKISIFCYSYIQTQEQGHYHQKLGFVLNNHRL